MFDIKEYTNFSIRYISIEKFHPDILPQWLSRSLDDVSNYFCFTNKDNIIISICSYLLKTNCICINGLYGVHIEECLLKTINHVRSYSLLNIFLCKSEYRKCIDVEVLQYIVQLTNIQLFQKPCYLISNNNTKDMFIADEKTTNKKRGRPPNLTPKNLSQHIEEKSSNDEKKKRGRPKKVGDDNLNICLQNENDEIFTADEKPREPREKMKARKSIVDH